MACCAVYGCNNNKKKNKDLKFYGFPKDEEIAKQWIVACQRKDAINTKSARICAGHFEKDNFHESLRHRLLGYLPRNCRNLKPEAVPTLKIPFKKDSGTENRRTMKVEKRTRRKIANEIIIDKSSGDIIKESENLIILNASGEALKDHPDIINVINASVITVQIQQDDDRFSDNGSVTANKAQAEQSQYGKATECECQGLINAANVLNSKCIIKYQQENEELKSEINNLNSQLEMLKEERKSFIVERLKPIFTDGQIRCLFQPVRKRICWSDEDITSAITLRSVSPNAYRYLREKMNYPLPAVSTLRKWVRMKLEREPTEQILELVREKMPSLASLED